MAEAVNPYAAPKAALEQAPQELIEPASRGPRLLAAIADAVVVADR